MKRKFFILLAYIIITMVVLSWIPTQVRLFWAILFDLIIVYAATAIYLAFHNAKKYED